MKMRKQRVKGEPYVKQGGGTNLEDKGSYHKCNYIDLMIPWK